MSEGKIVRKGGGVNVNDATATENDVLQGETFYSGDKDIKTGNIPSKGAETFTPTTSNQTISSGQYLSGTQTILGDSDLVPSNIKDGVNIFGVVGSYQGPQTYLSFDGVDDYVDINHNLTGDVERIDIRFNKPFINDTFTVMLGDLISFGSGTGDFDNETITWFTDDRFYTTYQFPTNEFIDVSLRWDSTETYYDFYFNDVLQFSTNHRPPGVKGRLENLQYIGKRSNNTAYTEFDVSYLAFYDSSGKVLEYLIDEGTGTTLTDSAGNNDGTIVGATWVEE